MITIALLVPVSSRGRRFAAVEQTELLRILIPSFFRTATWGPGMRYRVYLGYDEGDPFFDHPATKEALHRAFSRLAGQRDADIVLIACRGTEHAPCLVWNELAAVAGRAGCDFFYQLGDDIELLSEGWAEVFQAALSSNPIAPGLGVTGPFDENNPRLMTQSFVSRLHLEIFGVYYAEAFRNWWSDDWLMEVYWPEHLFWRRDVRVRNSGGPARYRIDPGARAALCDEVSRGRSRIRAWLPPRRVATKRLLAFSLWSEDPTCTMGAIRNAELARTLYPGWTCRFYVDETSVPGPILERLAALPNTELVRVHEPGDWRGRFWHFLPASEPEVEIVLSRNATARLSWRERAAVGEWLESDKDFHIMRDHPFHNSEIGGGMWGVRNGLLNDMRRLIVEHHQEDGAGVDRDFLCDRIYPLIRDQAFVHDEFFEHRPFPTSREKLEFVGQAFDENDLPAHPEHALSLGAALVWRRLRP